MTNLETAKKMLADLDLNDKEVEEVRDVCDMLAEIVVDGWFEKRKNKKQNERKNISEDSSDPMNIPF